MNKNTDAGISQPTRKSKKKAKLGEDPTPRDSLYYIQDAQGNSIDERRATGLGDHARRIWTSLREKGMAPESYLKMSAPALQYYRQMMYADYPELRLCEGHWKLERLGKDTYPNWYRKFKSKNEGTLKQVKVEGEKEADRQDSKVDSQNDGEGSGKKRRDLSLPSEVRPEKRARSETQPNTTLAATSCTSLQLFFSLTLSSHSHHSRFAGQFWWSKWNRTPFRGKYLIAI